MLALYRPELNELWFREQLLGDSDTMSYNAKWGGTIAFPESKWQEWYDRWVACGDGKRFYRYLKDTYTGVFVGETAYHYDETRKIWLADVIIKSEFRGQGFGTQGLRLLCRAAASAGIKTLYDDIAIDNPSVSLFLKSGFTEEYSTDEYVMLKKELGDKRKILVIGSPGSGKSTFARKLRDITGIPLYYLDMIYHRADRTTVSREEFDERLAEILKRNEWIIDGNYQRTLPLRFEKCTEVFFFDLPLEECLEGAASRIGRKREDMPWVESEFDPEFRQYIIDFQKDQIPVIYELIERYKDTRKITVFRSREEADRYLTEEYLKVLGERE